MMLAVMRVRDVLLRPPREMHRSEPICRPVHIAVLRVEVIISVAIWLYGLFATSEPLIQIERVAPFGEAADPGAGPVTVF